MPILQLFNCDVIVSLIANLVRTNLFTYKKMCDMKIHGSLFFLKIDFINFNLLRFAHILLSDISSCAILTSPVLFECMLSEF